MNWLSAISDFFRGRSADPLADLRREPDAEFVIAERARLHAQTVLDVLQAGEVTLHDATNCASGTYGAAVINALQRGWLSSSRAGAPQGYTRYQVTDEGRAALLLGSR